MNNSSVFSKNESRPSFYNDFLEDIITTTELYNTLGGIEEESGFEKEHFRFEEEHLIENLHTRVFGKFS